MAQESGLAPGSYGLKLDGRERLSLSGVTDVDSFDEAGVQLRTLGGTLQIRGDSLHMERLDLDRGEVTLTGRIDAAEYTDDYARQGGLLSRIFR